MEQTFYDDSHFRYREDNIKMLKRPMTLDLDSNPRPNNVNSNKRQKFNPLLTSPDMHMLKLASPELERLIISQNGLVTTTPTPTQFLFPKNVTEEQEQYAQGFVQALVQLHQSTDSYNGDLDIPTSNYSILQGVNPNNCSLPQSTSANSVLTTVNTSLTNTTSVMTSSSNNNGVPPSYTNSTMGSNYTPQNSFLNIVPHIKEEPQCVPNMGSPPMSPINMESQEKIKLERKRLRNRIAASKCRRRKLERIARLEDKVRLLKGENSELTSAASRLRDQVCQLKQQVMEHVKSGCQIMVSHSF